MRSFRLGGGQDVEKGAASGRVSSGRSWGDGGGGRGGFEEGRGGEMSGAGGGVRGREGALLIAAGIGLAFETRRPRTASRVLHPCPPSTAAAAAACRAGHSLQPLDLLVQ